MAGSCARAQRTKCSTSSSNALIRPAGTLSRQASYGVEYANPRATRRGSRSTSVTCSGLAGCACRAPRSRWTAVSVPLNPPPMITIRRIVWGRLREARRGVQRGRRTELLRARGVKQSSVRSNERLLAGVGAVFADEIGDQRHEPLDGLHDARELARLEMPAAVDDDDRPVELPVQRRAAHEELDRERVDELVGVLAVLARDVVAGAELVQLEVDVVEAGQRPGLVEQPLGADAHALEPHRHARDDDAVAVGGLMLVAARLEAVVEHLVSHA